MSESSEELMLEVRLSQIDEKMLEEEELLEVALKMFVPMRDVFRVTME